uniref:Uncharacterized protein n=1 Tax=Rhizophora mucronata TaxID=61149 RepID=A0A2P2KWT6_RHIMU
MKGTISGSSTSGVTRGYNVQLDLSIDQMEEAFQDLLLIQWQGAKATRSSQLELSGKLQTTFLVCI